MNKEKSWFHRFLAGIGIGVGAAIPGVSGAAVALIFRVYEAIINAVNGFTKHIKKSISTLLPILLGVFLAVILCVIVFDWAFEHCMFLLICLFAGFLIGSFPSVTNEVKGQPVKKKYIVLAIIGGLFVVSLGVASILMGQNGINVASYFEDAEIFFENWWMIIVLFFVGIVASVALTVPGFSGSLILLILGFYRPLIDTASKWGGQLVKGNFDNSLALNLFALSYCSIPFKNDTTLSISEVSKVIIHALLGYKISFVNKYIPADVPICWLVWGYDLYGQILEGMGYHLYPMCNSNISLRDWMKNRVKGLINYKSKQAQFFCSFICSSVKAFF